MVLKRKILAAAAAFAVLALAGCNDESYLPRNSRHYVPISNELQALMAEKGMRTHAPILLRAFKKESELEVWKLASSGRYELLKTFPMCRWSGQLGPKVREGDRQVPEGFYAITPQAMNPNSNFYLSFNVGYPNEFDRAHGRNGSLIMVHGDCSSRGCYAMTDKQIADIYALTREAFAGGQRQVQMQSLPFRMTAENLARYRSDPNIAFWKNLKQGSDHFEVTRREPRVNVCGRKYVFNGGECGGERDEAAHTAVAEKSRGDEFKVAQLVAQGARPVKRLYKDGDQHPVFRQQMVADAGETRPVGPTRNGVSREDALAAGVVDIPVDEYQSHKAKGRSATQIAEISVQQRIAAETAAAGGVLNGTNPVAGTPAAPANATPRPAAVTGQQRSLVAASPVAGTAAVALAPAPAQPAGERPLSERVLGGIGLGSIGLGGFTASSADTEATLKEHPPAPATVTLPPKR
jgi:murein L,D-transpeptidase YafK